MKDQTTSMYPLRRLVELKSGNISAAAREIACSPDMIQEALRAGRVATVVVIAAECVIRRQGPRETEAVLMTVDVPLARREEFSAMTRAFSLRVVHFCDACLVVKAPWRNVGAVQTVAKHLGGEAVRAEES